MDKPRKRSITIAGHATSISLEAWDLPRKEQDCGDTRFGACLNGIAVAMPSCVGFEKVLYAGDVPARQ